MLQFITSLVITQRINYKQVGTEIAEIKNFIRYVWNGIFDIVFIGELRVLKWIIFGKHILEKRIGIDEIDKWTGLIGMSICKNINSKMIKNTIEPYFCIQNGNICCAGYDRNGDKFIFGAEMCLEDFVRGIICEQNMTIYDMAFFSREVFGYVMKLHDEYLIMVMLYLDELLQKDIMRKIMTLICLLE